MSVDDYSTYEDSYENRNGFDTHSDPVAEYDFDLWTDDVLPECLCFYCRTKRAMLLAYLDGPEVWLWVVANHDMFEAFADDMSEQIIDGNATDAYALTSGAYAVKIARKVSGGYCQHAYGKACVTVLP